MTKKDFQTFATIFGRAQNLEEAIDLTIDHFKSVNPRFDEHRFRDWMAKVHDEHTESFTGHRLSSGSLLNHGD